MSMCGGDSNMGWHAYRCYPGIRRGLRRAFAPLNFLRSSWLYCIEQSVTATKVVGDAFIDRHVKVELRPDREVTTGSIFLLSSSIPMLSLIDSR